MITVTHRFGDFTLTARTRELKRGDVPIALSPRAFDCLAYLLEHRDRAVGKDELVAAIWGRVDVSDTQLGQTVLRARRAVDDDGQTQNVIRTVSRFGYRWVADVARDDSTQTAVAATMPADESLSSRPAAIDDESSPPPLSKPTRRLRARAWSSVAIALAAVAALFIWHVSRERNDPILAQQRTSAVVLPMRVAASDTDAWLRLGAMDLVAARLRAAGLAVPPSETTVALLHEISDEDAMTQAIRHVAPGALIVSGNIAHANDGWTIDLRAIAADGTRLAVKSARPDALDGARDASDRLLGRLGRAQAPDPPFASGVQQRLQRAQAAMLGNDLDSARAILVGDPELARKEPELGYRLASIDFRAGEYARADASLTSLLGEPAAADPAFRARVLDGRGAVRIREDDFVDAERDYDAAIDLLKERPDAAELGRALTGRGVARVMRRDFAPALADFGQARVQLEEAGDELAIARVDTNQGGLEMSRDRPQAAIAYLESAAAVFERYGAVNELMETLESLVSNHIVLLQPAEALAASDRSWVLAPRVTDPNQRLNLIEDRIDAFLALGRLHDAAALLGTLPDEAPGSNAFVARRLHALRARLALARGNDAEAAHEARRALVLPPPSDDLGEGIAEIALTYQRAVLSSAEPTLAAAPASVWIDFGKPFAYPVQALAAAEWSAWRGDTDEAGRRFQQALDLAESRGIPIDVASVTSSYGPWLLAHDRGREAGDVIGRVAPWADRDYDSALAQVRLFHALGETGAWAKALTQARTLAGERDLPEALQRPPRDHASIAAAHSR